MTDNIVTQYLLLPNRPKDFSDPLGLLRFNFMLQKYQMKSPYLYKTTHENGNEITIFGSMHNIPMHALPEKLRNFLLSFDVLISEALKQEECDQMNAQLEQEFIITEEQEHNKELPGWYHNMPLRVQQDLDAVFSTECTNNNVRYYLESNDMINTLQQYSSLSYSDGMDTELLEGYLDKPNKQAVPLEGKDGYQATIMNGNEWINTCSYERVMNMIAEDHYDSYIANGGVKMSDWQLTEQYLLHSHLEGDYDHTVASRNKLWMQSVKKWLASTQGTKLLVGGLAHMEGQGSLLELLKNEEFTIQELDLDGVPIDMEQEVLGC